MRNVFAPYRVARTETALIVAFYKLAKQHGFKEKDGYGQPISLNDSAKKRIKKIYDRLGIPPARQVGSLDLSRMEWTYCEPGVATLTYLGETTTHEIPPDIFLVGDCVGASGKVWNFHKKFVRHPFYQHGRTDVEV